MTARKPGWWVVCPTYQAGPFKTPEQAQRTLEAIEQLGACHETHRVEEAT